MKISPRMAVILITVLGVLAVLLGAFALAEAAEVSSVRASQYEWQCEDSDGNFISGHTRQDKAFQSCYNAALAAPGVEYFVRGGTFRVSATGSTEPPEPPIEPPVEPPVEPPDPTPEPQVTFGPVSALTEYPATISALKQDAFRWEFIFTANTIEGPMGLASRDEYGQAEAGHLSVWIENGQVRARHQDIDGGADSVILTSAANSIFAGTEHSAVVSIGPDGTGLWLDGQLVDSNPNSFGLTGNDLPLIVGGLCTVCENPPTQPDRIPDRPIDGEVYMEIWDDPLAIPQPTASLELSWVNPTEREPDEDGVVKPLPPEELAEVRLFRTEPEPRVMIAGVDPDQSSHEVTGLYAGVNYCFRATALDTEGRESDDSDEACKVP